jgi:hypothetical protein
MMTDLETKVEKYESKAAQCKESAQRAVAGPQRAIHEVLAGYYSELASDFRQAIEKRKASIVVPADPEVMPAMLGSEAARDVTPAPEGTTEQRRLPDDAPEAVAPGVDEQDGSAAS